MALMHFDPRYDIKYVSKTFDLGVLCDEGEDLGNIGGADVIIAYCVIYSKR